MEPQRKQLAEALKEVVDPELGVNIVDLGLVYDLRVEQGVVSLVLTMTTPVCPMSRLIVQHAEQALLLQPGVEQVRVDLVYTPPWSPQMIDAEARRRLGVSVQAEAASEEEPPANVWRRGLQTLKRVLHRSSG